MQYGLPATFSDVVLIFNKDLFDAAGLDYPTADWTWADEQAAAEKLTDSAAGVYGDFQPISFFEFYKALEQSGGAFFDDAGQAAFNSAGGRRGGAVADEQAGHDDADGRRHRRHAQLRHGPVHQRQAGDVAQRDLAVHPAQRVRCQLRHRRRAGQHPGRQRGVHERRRGLRRTDHPDEAAKWIEFLTGSPSTVDTRLASSWELPAVNDDAAFASYLEITPPENRQAVFDSLDHIALPPVIERQSEMQDIVTKALESIADGTDAQEALDGAVDEVNGLLG